MELRFMCVTNSMHKRCSCVNENSKLIIIIIIIIIIIEVLVFCVLEIIKNV